MCCAGVHYQVENSVGVAGELGHLCQRGVLPHQDLILRVTVCADLRAVYWEKEQIQRQVYRHDMVFTRAVIIPRLNGYDWDSNCKSKWTPTVILWRKTLSNDLWIPIISYILYAIYMLHISWRDLAHTGINKKHTWHRDVLPSHNLHCDFYYCVHFDEWSGNGLNTIRSTVFPSSSPQIKI